MKKKVLATIALFALAVSILILFWYSFSSEAKLWIQSRMVLAVQSGDLLSTRFWLRLGADPNQPNVSSTRTPLDIAVGQSDLEMIRLLFSEGVDLNSWSYRGILFETDNVQVARLLIQRGAEWERNINVLTAHAAECGKPELLEFYIELGGDPTTEVTNLFGHTPLEAAAASNSVSCCKILLDLGAGINGISLVKDPTFYGIEFVHPKNEARKTPLQIALIRDNLEVAEYLIKQGAEYDMYLPSTDLSIAGPRCKKYLESLTPPGFSSNSAPGEKNKEFENP